jgi:hypothetical protein
MNRVTHSLVPGIAVAVILTACDQPLPVEHVTDVGVPSMARVFPPGSGGAVVSNSGMGKDEIFCNYGDYFTTQGTAVSSPAGTATLSCSFADLPEIPEPEVAKGWLCTLFQAGFYETYNATWRRLPNGNAHVTCQFDGRPLYDTAVEYAGMAVPAQQPVWTEPLFDTPSGRLSGEVVHVGTACFWEPLWDDPVGKIAVIERGLCFYADKLAHVHDAGALAAIVFNSEFGGEQIIRMGAPEGVYVDMPAVFVGRSTGLALSTGDGARISDCASSKHCRGVF